MRTVRLRATMSDVAPRVTRTLDVPESITLDELHDVLQVALGWTDSHLHRFEAGTVRYSHPFEDWDDEDEGDEHGVRLTALPPRFTYVYDFGDHWHHEIEIVGSGDAEAGCVDGEGSCPPEDCGGPHGYAELLETLQRPQHADHAHMREWVGDRLRPFDLAAADREVRACLGDVPKSVRLLLGVVGEGVKLTPGGRLPRATVRAMQQHRPWWHPLDRPASIEEDLLPLAVLHDMGRRVGLLRLAKGVLRPTKAAADDWQVLRRLRSWFVAGSFDLVVAERAAALLVARGPMSVEDLAQAVLPLLGSGWRRGDSPMTARDVRHELWRLGHQLEALDMIHSGRLWQVGPSVLTVLPRVALLADLV
jgi:Plasmid pRiA4b ORF-3-like protein